LAKGPEGLDGLRSPNRKATTTSRTDDISSGPFPRGQRPSSSGSWRPPSPLASEALQRLASGRTAGCVLATSPKRRGDLPLGDIAVAERNLDDLWGGNTGVRNITQGQRPLTTSQDGSDGQPASIGNELVDYRPSFVPQPTERPAVGRRLDTERRADRRRPARRNRPWSHTPRGLRGLHGQTVA
jgi:hypothetical protein